MIYIKGENKGFFVFLIIVAVWVSLSYISVLINTIPELRESVKYSGSSFIGLFGGLVLMGVGLFFFWRYIFRRIGKKKS